LTGFLTVAARGEWAVGSEKWEVSLFVFRAPGVSAGFVC